MIRENTVGPDGKPTRKRYLPIGITADERICAGAVYAKLVNRIMYYINNIELLETPPETVKFEENNEYALPKPKKKRFKRKEEQESIAG